MFRAKSLLTFSLFILILWSLSACMFSPSDGQEVRINRVHSQITFAGSVRHSREPILIQAYSWPQEEWIDFTTATSALEPSFTDPAGVNWYNWSRPKSLRQFHLWKFNSDIGAAEAKFRAKFQDKTFYLQTFDSSSEECANEFREANPEAKNFDLIMACKSPNSPVATITSQQCSATDQSCCPNGFCREGNICEGENFVCQSCGGENQTCCYWPLEHRNLCQGGLKCGFFIDPAERLDLYDFPLRCLSQCGALGQPACVDYGPPNSDRGYNRYYLDQITCDENLYVGIDLKCTDDYSKINPPFNPQCQQEDNTSGHYCNIIQDGIGQPIPPEATDIPFFGTIYSCEGPQGPTRHLFINPVADIDGYIARIRSATPPPCLTFNP